MDHPADTVKKSRHTFVGARTVTPKQARVLAAELLAFAGPEVAEPFVFRDAAGDILHVSERAHPTKGVGVTAPRLVWLTHAAIADLIGWLQAHLEEHSA